MINCNGLLLNIPTPNTNIKCQTECYCYLQVLQTNPSKESIMINQNQKQRMNNLIILDLMDISKNNSFKNVISVLVNNHIKCYLTPTINNLNVSTVTSNIEDYKNMNVQKNMYPFNPIRPCDFFTSAMPKNNYQPLFGSKTMITLKSDYSQISRDYSVSVSNSNTQPKQLNTKQNTAEQTDSLIFERKQTDEINIHSNSPHFFKCSKCPKKFLYKSNLKCYQLLL